VTESRRQIHRLRASRAVAPGHDVNLHWLHSESSRPTIAEHRSAAASDAAAVRRTLRIGRAA
jgi:hypothetical protein